MQKFKIKNLGRRVVSFCLGLLILAFGVSFSRTADLGMSPVNSIPYVLSEIFPALSMGTWVVIIFTLYILVQFFILGKNVQPLRLLQLLGTVLFGYFTDFTNWLTAGFLPDPMTLPLPAGGIYGVRLIYLVISMVLIAVGILFYLTPELISLPSEGIMGVISEKTGRPFHNTKVCFDVMVSVIALVLSLLYYREFHGIREGTVVAAAGVGIIIGWLAPLKRWLFRVLFGERPTAAHAAEPATEEILMP